MLCGRVCLTLLTVLSTCSVFGVDASKCDVASHIGISSRSNDAEFNVELKNGEQKCAWTLLGDVDCDPVATCTIDIPKSDDDCSGDYVKITDGSRSLKKYCGKVSKEFRSSEGLRDLFIVVELAGAPPGKHGGVKCRASCVNPKSKSGSEERLPSATKSLKKLDQRCVCGLLNEDDRIVGGVDANKFEFPWQAALVMPGTRAPFCGGALINDQYILTAAHCFWFDQKPPEDVEVLLHAHLLDMNKQRNSKDVALGQQGSIRSAGYNLSKKTDAQENTKRFKVVEVITHPFFTEYYDYDYALLKLERKITFSDADAPTPICLPSELTWDSENLDKSILTVVGWGLAADNAGGTTRLLQKLDVPFISPEKCAIWYNDQKITQRMLCAGYEYGEKDACTGDSGGPLLYQKEKKYYQYGVVSWGEGCAREKKPGVYSRVTEMMQWIHFHTIEGDAKWCTG